MMSCKPNRMLNMGPYFLLNLTAVSCGFFPINGRKPKTGIPRGPGGNLLGRLYQLIKYKKIIETVPIIHAQSKKKFLIIFLVITVTFMLNIKICFSENKRFAWHKLVVLL